MAGCEEELFYSSLTKCRAAGLYRKRYVIDSAQGPIITIDGQRYINFTSNDYLGLANNTQLKEVMASAIKKYGIGAASSQLLVGHLKPHQLLEQKLSQFLARESTLVFANGYLANLALASVLIDSKTVVLQDKFNHASLIDSALLSKGRLLRYRHQDLEHLKTLLEQHKKHRLMIMTDGIFSMDGDAARLVEIVSLCKTYHAQLIVDDAHGIGVLGEKGAGLLEQLGLTQDQVPILMGTLSKAFGASGAFISGSALLTESLIQAARTYIYTTALLPAVAMTMVTAINIVTNEGRRLRKNLSQLIRYYKQQIIAIGLKPSHSESAIQPIIIGDAARTEHISNLLLEKKILARAIRPPTIPKGTSRLRINISAAHSKEQIDDLIEALSSALT